MQVSHSIFPPDSEHVIYCCCCFLFQNKMDMRWLLKLIFIIVSLDLSFVVSIGVPGDEYMSESEPAFLHGNKRLSNFVRIGRGLSSFVRIGKNDPETRKYNGYESDDNSDDNDDALRAFYELQPDDYKNADKRLSSFVRIGRRFDNNLPDIYEEPQKRAGAFMRMGKFPTAIFHGAGPHIEAEPYYRRIGRIGHSSFIRIGKRDTTAALQRAGVNLDEAEEVNEHEQHADHNGQGISDERLDRYIRLGKDLEDLRSHLTDTRPFTNKRMSNFVRIGRPSTDGQQTGMLF